MTVHYGGNCVGERKVRELVGIFKGRGTRPDTGRFGWRHNVTRVEVRNSNSVFGKTEKLTSMKLNQETASVISGRSRT
jgi:hypothetical protein